MAGKRKVRSTWRKPRVVGSLKELQELIDKHHNKKDFDVRVEALFGIREASSMQSILCHMNEDEDMGWNVIGMQHLGSIVNVEKMVGASALLLDEAIAYMEMEATAAAVQPIRNEGPSYDPDLFSTEESVDVELSARGLVTDDTKAATSTQGLDPSDDAVSARRFASDSDNDTVPAPLHSIHVPVLSSDRYLKSSSARRLAEAMLHAGTGKVQGPSPARLVIAHQVLDAGTPGDTVGVAELRTRAGVTNPLYRDDRVDLLADRMLEAGTGIRAQARLPHPAIVELAARVVSNDSPRPAPRSTSCSPSSSTRERRPGIIVLEAPGPPSSESYKGWAARSRRSPPLCLRSCTPPRHCCDTSAR